MADPKRDLALRRIRHVAEALEPGRTCLMFALTPDAARQLAAELREAVEELTPADAEVAHG